MGFGGFGGGGGGILPKAAQAGVAGAVMGPAGAIGTAVGGPLGNVVNPFQGVWDQTAGKFINGGGGAGGSPYQINPGERPELGSRQGITDASGNLLDNFKLKNDYGNQAAFDKLQQRATQEGPSPWLQMQLKQQGMQQMDQANSAARGAAGANAGARASLAMRGGLSGGAAERLARGGSQDLNARRQDIANQGAQQRMGLNIQDEATKTGLLKDATAANMAQMNYANENNKFNIANQLGDVSGKNQWNMGNYQEKMKAYGAANTANAIGAGGGGKK